MIVCHCHAVSDRTLRQRIREGFTSLDELGACCGAGTGCGGCEPTICEILVEELGVDAASARADGEPRTRLPVLRPSRAA